MNDQVIILDNLSVSLTDEIVLAKLHLDEENGEEALELAEKARKIMRPKAILRAFKPEVDADGRTVRAAEDIVFDSRILNENMKDVDLAVAYVISCGHELQELSDACTDPLDRYWQDEINECVLGLAIAEVQRYVEETFSISPLYAMSPGSLPDWPIGQQRPLFRFLGDVQQQIGVTLKPSCLMMPIKSVSGIYFTAEEHYVNCELCPRQCPNRRAPYREGAFARFDLHG